MSPSAKASPAAQAAMAKRAKLKAPTVPAKVDAAKLQAKVSNVLFGKAAPAPSE